MLERVLRWNFSAEERFFALTLGFAATWLANSVAVWLWAGFAPLREPEAALALFGIAAMAMASVWLYAVVLYCFYPPADDRLLLRRIALVLATPLLAAAGGLSTGSWPLAAAVLLLCVVWAGPFLGSRRARGWQIAASVAWTLAALTLWQDRLFHAAPVSADFRISNLITAGGVLCGVVGWALTGVALARRSDLPLRRIFGGRTALLLILWGAAYAVMAAFALRSVRETRELIADLERKYGHPVTAEEVRRMYFTDRRVDREFWEKLPTHYRESRIAVHSCPPGAVREFFSASAGEIPASAAEPWGEVPALAMEKWRRRFEGDPRVSEVAARLDAPLPACPREFRHGKLCSIELPELHTIRFLVQDYLVWHLRFALERRDATAAATALRRMEYAADYLEKDVFPISILVWNLVERHRLEALERVIASGLSSDEALRELSGKLAAAQTRSSALERRARYGELAMWADVTAHYRELLAAEGTVFPDLVVAAIFPSFWYAWEKNRQDLFSLWLTDDWLAADDPNGRNMPLTMIGAPARRNLAERFGSLRARYAGMRVLIAAELERRRTGRFPETLPDLPADPFTGRPLHYRVGKFRERIPVWNAGAREFSSAVRPVEGAAVWSIGADAGSPSQRAPKTETEREPPVFDRKDLPYVLLRRPVR